MQCARCGGTGEIQTGGCSLEHGHSTTCEEFGCEPLRKIVCPDCSRDGRIASDLDERIVFLVKFVSSVRSGQERLERIIAMSRDFKAVADIHDDVSPGYSDQYHNHTLGEFRLSLVLASIDLMREEGERLRQNPSENDAALSVIKARLEELMNLRVLEGKYMHYYDQSAWRESGIDTSEESDTRTDVAEPVRTKAECAYAHLFAKWSGD